MNPWNSEVTAVYGSLASQPVLTPIIYFFHTSQSQFKTFEGN